MSDRTAVMAKKFAVVVGAALEERAKHEGKSVPEMVQEYVGIPAVTVRAWSKGQKSVSVEMYVKTVSTFKADLETFFRESTDGLLEIRKALRGRYPEVAYETEKLSRWAMQCGEEITFEEEEPKASPMDEPPAPIEIMLAEQPQASIAQIQQQVRTKGTVRRVTPPEAVPSPVLYESKIVEKTGGDKLSPPPVSPPIAAFVPTQTKEIVGASDLYKLELQMLTEDVDPECINAVAALLYTAAAAGLSLSQVAVDLRSNSVLEMMVSRDEMKKKIPTIQIA